jgi:phosphoserine phosphatase RsbU/P
MSAEAQGCVLMVDDTEVNLRVLAGILEPAGYELLSAMDGDEALQLARTFHPDLVLLDVMMPGRDGFEVCAELKEDPATAEIPVIFLSGRADTAAKVRGLKLGAVDYVTKPFDRSEVLARVEVHVSLRRLTSALIQANDDLVDRQRQLDEDLRAAGEVQKALVYRGQPALPGLVTAGRFEPSAKVGGDLFNAVQLSGTSSALWILDVSGHGVPSALVSMCAAQSLTPMGGFVLDGDREPSRPSAVLEALDAIFPFERFEKFFTAAYVVFDSSTGNLTYSSGGHPPPLLVKANGDVLTLEEGGPLVGSGIGGYSDGCLLLAAGDRVVLYTDGVTEHESPDRQPFGTPRLIETLVSSRRESLDQSCGKVIDALRAFGQGRDFEDDVSIFAFQYTGGAR